MNQETLHRVSRRKEKDKFLNRRKKKGKEVKNLN